MGEGPRGCERGEQRVAERRGECGAGGILEETEVREGIGEAAVTEERGGGECAGGGKEWETRGPSARERSEEAGEVGRDGR